MIVEVEQGETGETTGRIYVIPRRPVKRMYSWSHDTSYIRTWFILVKPRSERRGRAGLAFTVSVRVGEGGVSG